MSDFSSEHNDGVIEFTDPDRRTIENGCEENSDKNSTKMVFEKKDDIGQAPDCCEDQETSTESLHGNSKVQNEKISSQTDLETLQSPVIAEKDHVRRAARFLCHASVENLPLEEKHSYLRSKGLSESDIVAANAIASSFRNHNFDHAWDAKDDSRRQDIAVRSEENGKGQHQNYESKTQDFAGSHQTQMQYHGNPYNYHTNSHPSGYGGPREHFDDPELPNPIIPMTIGGTVVLFGMAVLRWLNGGDFIIFPPSNVPNTNTDARPAAMETSQDALKEDMAEFKDESSFDDKGDCSYDACGHNETVSGVQQVCADAKEFQNDVGGKGHGYLASHNDLPLSQDLKALTLAIEKYSDLQERTLKTKLDEKARSKTNNVMELLLKKDGKDKKNYRSDQDGQPSKVDMSPKQSIHFQIAMIVQITEIKCHVKGICDQFKASELKFDKKLLTTLEEISSRLQNVESKLDGGVERNDKNAVQIEDKPLNQSSSSSKIENEARSHIEPADFVSNANSATPDTSTPSFENTNPPTIDGKAPKLPQDKSNVTKEVKLLLKEPVHTKRLIISGVEALEAAIQKMKENNTAPVLKSSSQMLSMYISNLSNNPTLKQYKKIYVKNKTFKEKVGKADFAKDVLLAAGFSDKGSYLEWKGDETVVGNEDNTNDSLLLLNEAATLLQSIQTDPDTDS